MRQWITRSLSQLISADLQHPMRWPAKMDSESRSESVLNSPTEADISLAASLTDTAEAQTLDEARKTIRELRTKFRTQGHQLLTWRRAHRAQEEHMRRLQREKADQLRLLSSQLLLFESRLVRKQKEISAMLALREAVVTRQQRAIESLTNKLLDHGIDVPHFPDFKEMIQDSTVLPDFESLNDSDSAVIMEDIDSDCSNLAHMPRFRTSNSDSITVVRSVSDAMDPNLKYTSIRRSNGFLRRPEILETVYSVEEEGDDSSKLSAQNSTEKDLRESPKSDSTERISPTAMAQNKRDHFKLRSGKITADLKNSDTLEDKEDVPKDFDAYQGWSYSYMSKKGIPNILSSDENLSDGTVDEAEIDTSVDIDKLGRVNHVITYNRVMTNHRNVTKVKDVKYKRINKAKSKSLEELRGRLRSWVDKGNKIPGMSMEQAQSYA